VNIVLEVHNMSKVPVPVLPRSVLIVEDDELIRELLREMLELEGYSTFVAENGEVALNVLKELIKKGLTPCLILLDLMMPVMDGREFLKHRQEDAEVKKIPVLLVSAAEEDQLQKLSVNGTIQGMIKKPFDLERLMSWVKKLVTLSGNSGAG